MAKGPLRIVLLTCAVLLLSTCTSMDRYPFVPPDNNCAAGKGNADRVIPVVCVDKSADGVTVHPKSIEAWDVGPVTKSATMIHWITRSGDGVLSIRMKDEGCIEKLECRRGHCRAKTRDIPEDSKKQCRYAVTLDGVELDPDVIIVDCCTMQ
ncbi:MAG TPA: hypothetical protein VNA69_04315 [Thermoanaerobaculia bacterium]|nr:hypothetical protein [Thermoanaerobaculia bacterium]